MNIRTLCMTAALGLAAGVTSAAEIIGFWDFNDGFDVANNTPQIVHSASIGSGTLYQQQADTDGNGKGGLAFSQSGFDGSPASITVSDGKSMAWDDVAKSGANDAEFFITFSTLGLTDVEISFDIEGNIDGGIASYDVKYDFNNLVDVTDPGDVIGTIKDFDGGNSTDFLNNQAVPIGTNSGFQRVTVNFGSALNNQSFVAVRFDDFKENDAMSIDNVLVTAIPEPGTIALVVITGLAAVIGLRRRS